MKYKFPSLDLLKYYNPKNNFTNREYVQAMADELASALASFKVKCKITDIRMTPFAVRFDVLPEPGVSIKSFQNLHVDLEVHMASPVEIVSNGDKKYTIGVAVKNWERPIIGLRDIMETEEYKHNNFLLPVAAGMDVLGKPCIFDLAATPHLLVAGTTGSGKSTFLNTIVLSLLYSRSPEQVKFVMIDPKGVELNAYGRIPHMLIPVIKDSEKALSSMSWVEEQMRDRYNRFARLRVKNIEAYNDLVSRESRMPRIVVIVDEYMEMMFSAPKELEATITTISRLARPAGIHLILATQRPSADVITNNIKANIPCRASFTVVDWRESKTILDRTGAERLLGNGDMLFSAAESSVPIHAQASYVSYDEVDRVIEAIG